MAGVAARPQTAGAGMRMAGEGYAIGRLEGIGI